MVRMPALSSTALFVTLSLHEMPRMRLKQRIYIYMKAVVSSLAGRAARVQDSLSYRRLLTKQALYTCIFVCSVSLLFVETLFVSLDSVAW